MGGRIAIAALTAALAAAFAAAPSPAATERVVDGGFEQGGLAWNYENGAGRCNAEICGDTPATGDYYGATYPLTKVDPGTSVSRGTIWQTIVIPDAPATLSFELRAVNLGKPDRHFEVRLGDSRLARFTEVAAVYQDVTVSIPKELTGLGATPLAFDLFCTNSEKVSEYCDRFDIDDVSLESGEADIGHSPLFAGLGPAQDLTPPETRIVRPKRVLGVGSSRGRASTSVEFSSEPGARFECRADRGVYFACASPKSLSLRKGRHILRVRAIDAAGNVDPMPAKARIRVRLTHGGNG